METTNTVMHQNSDMKHSTKAGWICIAIAAISVIIAGPFGWILAGPLALVAFILAIVAMSKGNTRGGLSLLFGSIGIPLLMQLLWVIIFVWAASSAG